MELGEFRVHEGYVVIGDHGTHFVTRNASVVSIDTTYFIDNTSYTFRLMTVAITRLMTKIQKGNICCCVGGYISRTLQT
jgi:hypothetical protein